MEYNYRVTLLEDGTPKYEIPRMTFGVPLQTGMPILNSQDVYFGRVSEVVPRGDTRQEGAQWTEVEVQMINGRDESREIDHELLEHILGSYKV